MSKYIIEIEDVPFSKVRIDADNGAQNVNLYRAEGFNSLVFDQFGLDKLTPLDKALSSELGEAYHKGFEVGSHEATTLEYQQGLNDAWECAKYLFSEMSNTEINLVFPHEWNNGGFKALMALHPQDAIDRIKAYEEQQKADKRIMFGDGLVTKHGGVNGIALSNEVNRCVYVWREDCVAYEASVDEWKKTGKTYPQVAELHEAMKESGVTE